MLGSTYDILELFERAFDKVRVLGEIIQIDCFDKIRYAEGTTKSGIQWRIEADIFNRKFQNQEQLQQGYAHLGESLLVPFYQSAKAKVEAFGWTDSSDIEKYANTAMAPVLSAMRFNMGIAAERGGFKR